MAETDKRHSQQVKPQHGEALYQSVIAAMQEGVVVQDADGKIIAFNASAERILGLTSDELMGLTSRDPRWRPVHEDGTAFPFDQQPGATTLRTGQPRSNVVMGVHRADDTLIWVLANSQPVARHDDGTISAVVVTFAEITATKLAQQAVVDSEQRYRLLFENSLDAILLTRPNGSILAANPAACHMLGRTEDELRQGGRNSVADASDPRLAAALSKRAQTGAFQGELTMIRADGTHFPAEVCTSVYRNANDEERTSMIIRDLTERRRAETELHESERRFAEVFRRAGVGIILLGLDGYIRETNPALQRMLGYDAEALNARHFGVFVHQEDQAATASALQELVDGMHDLAEVEARFRRKNGEVRSGRAVVSVISDSSGRPSYCIGLVEDVTDRKHAEGVELERARLEGVLLAARTMQHELNNRLALIAGYAEFLAEAPAIPPGLREPLAEIVRGSQEASTIIGQLVRVTRVEPRDWGPGVGTTLDLP